MTEEDEELPELPEVVKELDEHQQEALVNLIDSMKEGEEG